MKKVLLLWYQEGDNFGDILLYRTTRDFLSDLDIMVVSCEVGSPCIDVFEKANKTDFLLFAGGGIIEGIPSVIKYFEEDYKLLKVPYGVIGLGVSCFDYTNYSQQLRFWIENAKFFYVRDDYSANRLMKYTKLNNIKSSADCVFWNKELVKYGNALGGEIGINLRDIPEKLKIGGVGNDDYMKVCIECGVSIVIPDSSGEYYEKNDVNGILNYSILKRYKYLDKSEKVEVTINEIRRCDYIIAMRFHVIVVSAILGVIPIPIIYHPKVRELVKELQIEEISVEMYELV